MWDPEQKKQELELKKKQAIQKTQLGPIGGTNKPVKIIPESLVMDRDDTWVFYFRSDENMRNAYGVKTENKRWVIVDNEKFKQVDSAKREKLRPHWNKPL